MKYLITLLIATNLFAQDRAGNGGNFTDAQIAGHQATLDQTVSKIRTFLKSHPELQKTFPEFELRSFYDGTKRTHIEAVDEELFDKEGEKRTCTNLPYEIKCDVSELEKIKDNASSLFVLVFHELLGSVGIVDNFKISNRIAAFVTKVQNYDLRLEVKSSKLEDLYGTYQLKSGDPGCERRQTIQIFERAKDETGFAYSDRYLNSGSQDFSWIQGHKLGTEVTNEKHFIRKWYGSKRIPVITTNIISFKDGVFKQEISNVYPEKQAKDIPLHMYMQARLDSDNNLVYEEANLGKCLLVRKN